MKSKGKKTSGNLRFALVMVICGALLLHGGYNLFKIFRNYRQADDLYADISAHFVSETDVEESAEVPGEGLPPLQVDFARLQEKNPDIIGWIYVGCADISYPVLQAKDNDYYLHRDYRGQYLYAGSIFADYRNSRHFSDINTILYGHNMKNGSMFGRLKRLGVKKYYETDRSVWLFTPEGAYCYEALAVFETSPESYAYRLFDRRGDDYAAWCKKMMKHALPDTQTSPAQEGSRNLILSTCSANNSYRTVVLASMAEGESEEDDMSE